MTWQLQKGRYYGACQRRNEACKNRKMIREDQLQDRVLTHIDELDSSHTSSRLLRRLVDKFESRRQPYIGNHRETVIRAIRQRIRRAEQMEDNLYEDKLAGVIDNQKYTQKLKELQNELVVLRSRLENLESFEAKQPNIEKPDSIRELYLRESKTGKRIIIHELFVISMRGGAVCIDLKAK